MHKLAEKIADCLKAKVEGMGIDNIEGAALEELGEWVDILKDIACYDKDMRIIKAMDEAEDSEESMKYIEMYEDYPEMRKGYRRQPRDSRGRYMSRRGYEEPMDYDMMPEWYRDMDREHGKMYFADGGNMGGGSSGGISGGSRGYSEGEGGQYASRMQRNGMGESRYDRAKRGYEETKAMHKSGTAEDKQITMKEAEKMINVIFDEIDEMLEDAPQELKSMIKTKGMAKMQKIN